jgi:hypothetical protein
VSFTAINPCVVSQQMFVVVIYLVVYSIRKILDTPSYNAQCFTSTFPILHHGMILTQFFIIFNDCSNKFFPFVRLPPV